MRSGSSYTPPAAKVAYAATISRGVTSYAPSAREQSGSSLDSGLMPSACAQATTLEGPTRRSDHAAAALTLWARARRRSLGLCPSLSS